MPLGDWFLNLTPLPYHHPSCMEEEPKETVETGEEGKEVEEANKEENETKTKSDESTEDAKMLPSEEDALLENEEGETEGRIGG